MNGTPPTRAARLLTLAGNAIAVLVILDTLVRLGREPGGRMPARSAEAAAERLRGDPALRRHLAIAPPLSSPGRALRWRAGSAWR